MKKPTTETSHNHGTFRTSLVSRFSGTFSCEPTPKMLSQTDARMWRRDGDRQDAFSKRPYQGVCKRATENDWWEISAKETTTAAVPGRPYSPCLSASLHLR